MDFSGNTIFFFFFFSLQVSIVDEQIEDDLFRMLDEETDSEYVEEIYHLCYLGFYLLCYLGFCPFSCNEHPK